ncbi:hypothetical protein HIM_05374 [Hirsutella minnesotensis 3608]|uniref:Uncharacterized protein n=1 Tax=Hirsutella minnesotensis 3608 TaxID=1043627 RepID=A0A0F7ZPA9_9HYPO|nr:hypothetical protein HIM_05374 [Hirsutella minnesotensis 3608]
MAASQGNFTITAIAASNGHSIIQCWQLYAPVQLSNVSGTAGASNTQLGSVESCAYTIIPPNFDGGLHNAPAAQYVSFLSGSAHITVPGSQDEAVVDGGADGLIIVTDTVDVSKQGHRTVYPEDNPTVALQIPLERGRIPKHIVLHSGPCTVHAKRC